jgi:hypothetical protein
MSSRTAESQLTVFVEVERPDGFLPADVRALPVWTKAIAELLPEAERAIAWPRLEAPAGVFDAWTVVANGKPFRCIVMWAIEPMDNKKPRYIGRVDVRLRFA